MVSVGKLFLHYKLISVLENETMLMIVIIERKLFEMAQKSGKQVWKAKLGAPSVSTSQLHIAPRIHQQEAANEPANQPSKQANKQKQLQRLAIAAASQQVKGRVTQDSFVKPRATDPLSLP